MLMAGNLSRSGRCCLWPSLENTPEARRDALKLDADLQQVWPDRIQCRSCEQIILMPTYPLYTPDSWLRHKAQCIARDTAIKQRLENAAAIRKEILENDWHVMALEPHRIHCRVCNRDVELDKDLPYSLGMWDSHRKECGQPPKCQKSQVGNVSKDISKDSAIGDRCSAAPDPDNDKSEDKDGDINMVDTNGNARSTEKEVNAVIDVDEAPTTKDTADTRLEYLMQQMDVFRIEPQGPGMPINAAVAASNRTCTMLNDDEMAAGTRSAARKRTNAAARPMRSLPKGKGKAPLGTRAISPMLLPPLPPRPRWPGEDERKQQFLSDPDVVRVEPHRLLCQSCGCWIRLHPVVRYSQSTWPKHKVPCKSVQLHVSSRPGDARVRAKSEKEDIRRILLESDPYIGELGPHRVSCQACGTSIRLDTTYKYEGSHWRAHKARCAQIPFHDRNTKKRKGQEGRRQQGSPQYQEPMAMAMANSSDSEDSDASSAPRPRPTAVFTAPLEINLTKMFRPRPLSDDPPMLTIDAAKAKLDAELLVHLEGVAENISTSDRLGDIINTVGDGITTEERLAERRCALVDPEGDKSDGGPECGEEARPRQPSPTPDPEAWMPRKRAREEDAEFDTFFNKRARPNSPIPKGKLRVCKLDKEAMQAID
ncbi:hypothetical protein BU17DRAFT_103683 [Hysterangium stoloniferum]|nr:hypothetical protein BU17DRAFT_103683 [Hysterangium stoloniferum]